jgi:3-phenylpropionate/trans-cinnamate dioxygenase ferredoxin reductase subunit
MTSPCSAETTNRTHSHHRLVEHWTTAADQAAVVAHSIAKPGEPQRLTQVPYFWSDQYDMKIQALGFVGPAA